MGDLRKKDSFFDDNMELRKKDSFFSDKRRESAFDDLRRDSNSFGSALSNSRHGSLFEEDNGVSRVVYEDDLYKILINVDKYQPEELMIKTVDNNVIVEAKHEEKTSDGRSYSTQSFNQSFNLPRGVNPESVTSSLSKSGILTISAPLPKPLKLNGGERLIPIKHS